MSCISCLCSLRSASTSPGRSGRASVAAAATAAAAVTATGSHYTSGLTTSVQQQQVRCLQLHFSMLACNCVSLSLSLSLLSCIITACTHTTQHNTTHTTLTSLVSAFFLLAARRCSVLPLPLSSSIHLCCSWSRAHTLRWVIF